MRFDDTIFAPASAPGKAAVALVRVSGIAAGEALRRLSGGPLPPPRQAALHGLADPISGAAIDRALVLWFPGPESYTGEDVAEFHVHGGRAVIAATLAALGAMKGLRPAEAGEFSRRAFEHGKLDLTAAEGIADLVDAETEIQRLQALRQSGGALGELYEGWRLRLLKIRALVELSLDFSDQELPDDVLEPVPPEIAALTGEIAAHLGDSGMGERLRDGVQVAILGPVNAGKSSLLNRLAGRDAAIVATEEGTTRDIVEVRLDLAGWPL
ncbi:MAG: 50S ribosome-binding GTPase, partial [Alphaproteobacteria bacterium]|nr:50S ribosome-binding GTPase [Alphaproteobacteria bacterium]